METLLIGAALGAGLAVAAIFGAFKVKTREAWEKEEQRHETTYSCLWMVTAENAKLRVALAAGEMTEEGKKVAAMTMAALSTVIRTNAEVVLTPSLSPDVEPPAILEETR